jgi:hypothetical protein
LKEAGQKAQNQEKKRAPCNNGKGIKNGGGATRNMAIVEQGHNEETSNDKKPHGKISRVIPMSPPLPWRSRANHESTMNQSWNLN